MADSLRKAAGEGKIEQVQADKQARVYDFLASCDEADIETLFDSSAFNDIAKSYLRLAVKELTEENVIDEEQATAVRNRYSLLFSEMQSGEVNK